MSIAAILTRLRNLVRKFKSGVLLLLVERSAARLLIERDIECWARMDGNSHPQVLLSEKLEVLLYAEHLEEFRSLLFYRLGPGSTWLEKSLLGLSECFFPPRICLVIDCPSVAPGLIIKHGLDTVIEAERIGENCLIFHDVYIGMKNWKSERPTLGNYVHVSTGAKIMGKINIGDHSVIAANSVVTRDIPPNSLAIGIPARIILNAGNKAEYIASGAIPADLPPVV